MFLFATKQARTNEERKELSEKKTLLTLALYSTCNIIAEEVKTV